MLSLFRIHNETWNCWSHLLGVVLFASVAWYAAMSPSWLFSIFSQQVLAFEFMDQLVFLVALFGFVICFTASTCFHCFGCCSEPSANRLLQLDYMVGRVNAADQKGATCVQ
jgi:adiponectin receptor